MDSHREYYVQVRNLDGKGTSGHHTAGFLKMDGTYYALPGITPGCNQTYRAGDLPDDVVMLTAQNQRGELRSVAERKAIADLAERHGFPIRRGAPETLALR